MRGRHYLVGVFGFVAGVALFSFLLPSWAAASMALVLSFAFLALWTRNARPALLTAALFFLCMSLGMGRVALVPQALPESFLPFIGTHASFKGVIVADPDMRETSQRLVVEVEHEGTKTRVLAVAALFPEFRYGERVRVSGVPELSKPFETGEARAFRYDRFLAKDGVFALMPFAQVEFVGPREGAWNVVRGALADMKVEGSTALSAALPEPHASLASGLILGGKQGLGESLLDDFVRSGLVHIVVLSGYNVMLVAQFVLLALGVFGKRAGALAAALAVGLFVLAAGAGPASVRAGLMASIALYARATGHSYAAFRALVGAALLMLLVSPLTLVYDPGFQLSFLATLGLIFGAPLVERSLAFLRHALLRELVASTVAAQVAVLPLLLYQNGVFSLVALPANLLVLPVVPFTMLASFLALVAGAFMPLLAPLFAFPAFALLSYVIGLVQFSANLPLAAVSVPAFPFVFVIAAYGALAFLVARADARLQRL